MSKFTLPNGVIHDGKLYNIVELDEIRGKHQNMLVNPNPKTPIDHIEPLLSDLILDIHNSESESIFPAISRKDLVLNKLPIQDIQFLLVKVREVSYDKNYHMKLKCNHCEADNNAKLDLSVLSITPRKDKLSEAEQITPKDQTEFRYGHMNLGHLIKLVIDEGKSEQMYTKLTSMTLKRLGDNIKVQPSDLDELKGSDLQFILDNAPELAQIDMEVEHTCSNPKCGKDFKQELPVMAADFLLHTRT